MGDSMASCQPAKSSLQLLHKPRCSSGNAEITSMLALHGQLPHSGYTKLTQELSLVIDKYRMPISRPIECIPSRMRATTAGKQEGSALQSALLYHLSGHRSSEAHQAMTDASNTLNKRGNDPVLLAWDESDCSLLGIHVACTAQNLRTCCSSSPHWSLSDWTCSCCPSAARQGSYLQASSPQPPALWYKTAQTVKLCSNRLCNAGTAS